MYTIRKDIFAVKQKYEKKWMYVFMTTNKKMAFNKFKEIETDRSIGIIRKAKVVNPSQRIVDLFLVVGNKIYK